LKLKRLEETEMKRLEIIANKTIEDDLFDAFERHHVATSYTLIPVVHGAGHTGLKLGTTVWPNENFLLIIYCEESEAETIRSIIFDLKKRFKGEGIKLFEIG